MELISAGTCYIIVTMFFLCTLMASKTSLAAEFQAHAKLVKQVSESGVPTSEQLINEANVRMLTEPSISTLGASRAHSYACIVQYVRENHTQICVHIYSVREYVPERCASNALTDTKRESESTDDS
ncbi:hypothetical protein ALC60_11213 [Trachymyrmex zeteki]|uniref:Uncharacterized protein n=1 Tax=Mycetomoellerius zeteki TaxID=64791 RepID=A0A151WP59_9HYME|nr:hypothetical protein ALC60_11213 [Trachymyrmex zeteki]